MISVDTLRLWSEQICAMASGGRDEAAKLFGASMKEGDDAVDPPPAGAIAIRVYDDITTHSQLAHVEIELAIGISLSALSETFGAGSRMPRVHAGSPYRVSFHVERPTLPCSCDVIATFDEPPSHAAMTASITLRRNYLFK
jgi:hypothetical protein